MNFKHPAKTITDADYADDLALLANRLAQVEFLLHNLEQAAGSIDHYASESKTVYVLNKEEPFNHMEIWSFRK